MHYARAVAAESRLNQMFLFTLFGAVTPDSVLGEIWYKPGAAGEGSRVGLI